MGYFGELYSELNPIDVESQAYLSADCGGGQDLEAEPKAGRRYPYQSLGSISVWDSEGLVNQWVECLGCHNVNRIQVQHVASLPRERRNYHRCYCPNCGKFNGRYRSDASEQEIVESYSETEGHTRFEEETEDWEKRFREEHCKQILQNYRSFEAFAKHWDKKHPDAKEKRLVKLLNDLAKAVYGSIEELPCRTSIISSYPKEAVH